MTPSLEARRATAERVAKKAGASLRAEKGKALMVDSSEQHDVKLELDRRIQEQIRKEILQVYREDGFLGEEGGEAASAASASAALLAASAAAPTPPPPCPSPQCVAASSPAHAESSDEKAREEKEEAEEPEETRGTNSSEREKIPLSSLERRQFALLTSQSSTP